MSARKPEPIEALIERSSIGEGMKDIRENGIDAHLRNLERDGRAAQFRRPSTHGVTVTPIADRASWARERTEYDPPEDLEVRRTLATPPVREVVRNVSRLIESHVEKLLECIASADALWKDPSLTPEERDVLRDAAKTIERRIGKP